MSLKIAFLIYNGVAELDFIGPKGVFFASNWLRKEQDHLYLVASSLEPITTLEGMKVPPDYDFASAPLPDILVVPGSADPAPQLDQPDLLKWVEQASRHCTWTTSICTGAAILLAAGPAKGRRITSHWMMRDALRLQNEATVIDNVRYVVDDHLVTSAGVSAGIDMALWLVGELRGPEHAREVQHALEYYPEPPYQLETTGAVR
ncbi:MAG: DJ-1/PfpI family protein [Nitrospira sp.]|nr:MAG: DJ-1/PfpI family protein [Nitrospira sp.]